MPDYDERRSELLYQTGHELEHLSLGGHIKRRRGFIRD